MKLINDNEQNQYPEYKKLYDIESKMLKRQARLTAKEIFETLEAHKSLADYDTLMVQCYWYHELKAQFGYVKTRTIKSPPKPRLSSLKAIKEAVKKAPPERVSVASSKANHH